ncbi:hypothetical protein [Microbacterium trichothecenolyticum]|uniref:Uncharacterized protein n=1 Tax=Microbacterium trichothecenolyticum TaxID=69370 RepID=A0A0M2HG19_MICTR|nr:hypothetical protein [Microbacterium trichothecenolyticum]KJL45596.1 hypothetical protein RS82_00148 [Microbacterium trichothecenolyticum]
MQLTLIIILAILVLFLLVGTIRGIADSGVTAGLWINALRNVIITILIALVVLAALPIVEAALT